MEYQPHEFQWWKDKRAGKPVKAHPDVPMQGFYRFKAGKAGTYTPVRIWYTATDPRQLVGYIGTKRDSEGRLLLSKAEDIMGVWQWCLDNPVSKAEYDAVVDRGEPWHDEIVVTKADGKTESSHQDLRGHNSGESDFTALTGDIEEWARSAAKIGKAGVPSSKGEADAASDAMTKLADLKTAATNAMRAETKPLRDEVDKINARWQAFIKKAEDAIRVIAPLVTAWTQAERKRREDEAANLKAAAGDGVEVKVARVTAGTRRSVGSVKRKEVVIENLALTAEYLAKMETPPHDFVDAVEKAAYRLLQASVTVPGARLETKESIR